MGIGVFGPVAGLTAITEFYRRFLSCVTDMKHIWTTEVLDARTTKRVIVDTDGLITHLRAESVLLS
ncbi:hypothetical protein [Streptomyces sp. DSM 15324]|uniref:hypothetical protein n=1 Tax=Streptomyces sp. DSM 15324 TaxID=1739111 RepID=UPI000747E4E3|nr:hypothetical protein [Streptomyces sp. DSM 15324]KUO10311.1 hypothetical protein AQJ58_20335 [Streptomyces sp. DSM 15324]